MNYIPEEKTLVSSQGIPFLAIPNECTLKQKERISALLFKTKIAEIGFSSRCIEPQALEQSPPLNSFFKSLEEEYTLQRLNILFPVPYGMQGEFGAASYYGQLTYDLNYSSKLQLEVQKSIKAQEKLLPWFEALKA